MKDESSVGADTTGQARFTLGNRWAKTPSAARGLILFLSGTAAALVCVWLTSLAASRQSGPQKHTFSSFDPPRGDAAKLQFDTGKLLLADADLDQLLNLYQEVSARTVIRGPNLPKVKISLHNQNPLTRVETLQLLDTTLVENGITMVLAGDASVKAVQNGQAQNEPPPTIELGDDELPDSSSYMTCTVALKNKAEMRDVVEVLMPFSRAPKSIIAMPSSHLLILRDYSANIRQMLQLIPQVDRPSLPWVDLMKPSPKTAGTTVSGRSSFQQNLEIVVSNAARNASGGSSFQSNLNKSLTNTAGK
jgi:type II secretory pathway component GspD/PulD (secretin)